MMRAALVVSYAPLVLGCALVENCFGPESSDWPLKAPKTEITKCCSKKTCDDTSGNSTDTCSYDLVFKGACWYGRCCSNTGTCDVPIPSPPAPTPPVPAVPAGVNLGGWLNLEDWFFSGAAGAFVSTGDDMQQGQGACLPPGATQLPTHWPSEGRLVKMLNESMGPEQTAEIFMSHRRSFIGNDDLDIIQSLGITTVRVPLNWAAFADALSPIDADVYGQHDPEQDAVLVPDLFYSDTAALVTVPRAWLRTFITRCASRGIQVLLDMHAFPGGSSQGTYNGVWPSPPVFWLENSTIGNRSVTLTQAGHMIVEKMVEWVESLPATERMAVTGLTLMNEPAHLSAWQDWASEVQVLEWLATASDTFRSSTLPSAGTRAYMNLIGTAFEDFWSTVPAWWNKTFSQSEQHTWAVMDVHHYGAWGGSWCSGRTVGGGAYFCDQPLDEIEDVMKSCVSDFTDQMTEHFPGLKSCSEFSLGTFDQARFACTDKAVTRQYLQTQVRAFNEAQIEPFFWTWRMPYGPSFEAGWSLKHALGKESAHLDFPCMAPTDAHISSEVEV